jgi:crotonobetainyl-CoA:carnitine CoA-transferase CaiB-like acyl-CoA transferase
MNVRLPLDGMLVVSLEHAVAAPFATRQLADLGARVIKIERPEVGDFARAYDESVNGLSSYFVWLNRSKESLTLDAKTEDGRAVLRELLDRADVFVHNLAPGAVDRLGFGPDELRREFPRLVDCSISGYGETGDWSDKRSYDLLAQAEAGLLDVTGDEEHRAKVGISVADIAAGMYAYSGVLGALLIRARDGVAPRVTVSLFEALCEWMGSPMLYAAYSGKRPRRTGAFHATIAPYGPFPASDGIVMIAVQNNAEWGRFCTGVLGRPELIDDERFATNSARVAHRDDLHAAVESEFLKHSVAELDGLLDGARIAHGRLSEIIDLVENPALGSRGRWREIATSAGPVRSLIPPADLEGTEPRMLPVPALGQHTDAVLAELGYSEQRIAALRAAGAI